MPSEAETPPLLAVRGLRVSYGKKEVLHGIDLDVAPGEVVALLGHNGAGKTTTLRSIMGAVSATAGSVTLEERALGTTSVAERLRRGLAYTEPRGILPGLSVAENLELATHVLPRNVQVKSRLERALELFPVLKEKFRLQAGTLSGGQRQMLALGMALMVSPRLLLLDEPLLGLAPRLQGTVMEAIGQLAERDQVSVVLVDQNIRLALEASMRAYVIRAGEIVGHGEGRAMLEGGDFWDII